MPQTTHYESLIEKITNWMAEAEKTEPNDPNAVCLSTCTKQGRPSTRIVLLKNIDAKNHFVIFTNKESRKGREMTENPFASLCLYWKTTHRQIRIEGRVEEVTDQEADAYFQTRQRGSQIGAWASLQSRPMTNRAELEKRIHDITQKYKGQDVPRPRHWTGFRIIPDRIEFWEAGEYRLHNREIYEPSNDDLSEWEKTLLFP